MSVIVRFAPSPTGYLHIGGARTALFNWMYARHWKGKFLIRIEDTDRERSTQQAIDAIFKSLKWLNLDWDEEPVFQFARAPRHASIAKKLVTEGKAYYCYCSIEELEDMRKEALAKGLPPKYNGYWRDRDPHEAPKGIAPVIRFKAPRIGKTRIHDLVQGDVEIDNSQLDDMILLRADGTPTYMLSVVVDDHDMEITHVIRGDDHLTNAFRQYHLYQACGWEAPTFAHIPLIYGPDGAKLSKRHGAIGAEQYQEMGFLPEAMENYLMRLGWAHGNDEIISREEAIQWFDIQNVGQSPARFDMNKLTNLNGYYIRRANNQRLVNDISPRLRKLCSDISDIDFEKGLKHVLNGMNGLKERAKTLEELAQNTLFYIKSPHFEPQNDTHILNDKKGSTLQPFAVSYMNQLVELLRSLSDFTLSSIESCIRASCEQNELKLGDFIYPARIALTGTTISPSLFEIIEVLGCEIVIQRIENYCKFLEQNSAGV